MSSSAGRMGGVPVALERNRLGRKERWYYWVHLPQSRSLTSPRTEGCITYVPSGILVVQPAYPWKMPKFVVCDVQGTVTFVVNLPPVVGGRDVSASPFSIALATDLGCQKLMPSLL